MEVVIVVDEIMVERLAINRPHGQRQQKANGQGRPAAARRRGLGIGLELCVHEVWRNIAEDFKLRKARKYAKNGKNSGIFTT